MSFKDAACHVWAIDGYLDDNRAIQINNAFADYANELTGVLDSAGRRPVKRRKPDPSSIIKNIVEAVREEKDTRLTNIHAIVYGGFRGAGAPEHMWVEYDGRIYDTMPGYVLFSVPADVRTRKQPFMEVDSFEDHEVGKYETYLTENQRSFLASVDPIVAPHVGFGAGIDYTKAEAAAITIQGHFRAMMERRKK